jgi:hypothetical protein
MANDLRPDRRRLSLGCTLERRFIDVDEVNLAVELAQIREVQIEAVSGPEHAEALLGARPGGILDERRQVLAMTGERIEVRESASVRAFLRFDLRRHERWWRVGFNPRHLPAPRCVEP